FGWIGFGIGLALSHATGCVDDLYVACEIGSSDDFSRTCGNPNDETISCAVEPYLQCQTRVCGRYRGSDAFCTQPCNSDAECNGGVCREFVLQTNQRYCVQSEVANR